MAYRKKRKASKRQPQRATKARGRRRARKGRGGGRNKASNSIRATIKEMKNITEPRKFSYTFGYRSSCSNGVALYVDLCTMNDSVDIANMHNKLFTQLGLTGLPLNKFAVGGFKASYDIKNASNVDCTCDVYKVVPRTDIDISLAPLSPWNGLGTINYAQGPINTLALGYQEATAGTVIGATNWPIGITPFMINKFTTYFKVIKVSKFNLIGGAIKSVKIRMPRWNIWNGTKVNGTTSAIVNPYTMFKNKTVAYFMICRGMPVNDSVVGGNVTTGPVNLDIVGVEEYSYTGIPNAQAKIDLPINALQSLPNAASFITERTELKVGVVTA